MFEYLMPNLFMESYPNTLMDESCRVAIEQQIKYAIENSIPWGTSEASYYNFDAQQVYQYQAFGVPSLGYKRGLSNDLVVAPYASILALPFLPQVVMQNLGRLEGLNMWGLYGLYESVDFTPDRLKTGESHAVIRSYMVHHQGMILLTLCNYLFDKRMIKRFHTDPRIESVELLLQEQTPVHAPTEHPRHQQVDSMRPSATIPLDPVPKGNLPQLRSPTPVTRANPRWASRTTGRSSGSAPLHWSRTARNSTAASTTRPRCSKA